MDFVITINKCSKRSKLILIGMHFPRMSVEVNLLAECFVAIVVQKCTVISMQFFMPLIMHIYRLQTSKFHLFAAKTKCNKFTGGLGCSLNGSWGFSTNESHLNSESHLNPSQLASLCVSRFRAQQGYFNYMYGLIFTS